MTKLANYSIRSQLMWLSLIIVAVSIALSLSGTLLLTLSNERKNLDSNLLNSASVIARVPLVGSTLCGQLSTEELSVFLDSVTANTSDIDLILVGNTDNILYYAPDPVDIGTRYTGTVQQRILTGSTRFTSDESGPMGSGHSAYAPVHDRDGTLLGFVIVGVYTRSMTHVTQVTVLRHLGIALLAGTVGGLLALRLSRRIKDSLMGYEPAAFAHRLHQREDILEALEEGVLAIDQSEVIIYLNQAAAKMLSLNRDTAVGQALHTVYPSSTLHRVLRTGKSEYNVSMKSLKDIRVISDRLPIFENGKPAGAVGIFRNRTEVTRLAEDLTGVRHMVDAMRAYTHEFMNKLHVIAGLLQIGAPEKAQQYIMDTTRIQQEVVSRIMEQIKEPSVAALLVGKTSRANELGIRLTLDRNSVLMEDSPWLPPNAFITILGNFIENAIEALNQFPVREKMISVSIREDSLGLLLCVEDTGPGIQPTLRETLFQRGVSSKGETRGTGLALAHDLVDTYHGEIRVESESGVGTSFFISFRRAHIPDSKEEESDCTRL